jgi:chromosomal replication initiation ATPase DnaA
MSATAQFKSALNDLARAFHRVEELARAKGRGRRFPKALLKLTPAQIAVAERIVRVVAEQFGVSPSEIGSGLREQPAIFYRQVAILMVHRRGGLTTRQTGRFFGRGQSAIAHALDTVEARRETEGETALALAQIESKIK